MTLLERVQDTADGTAWSDFVDLYAPQIFSWCRRFHLQESDAADVTQDVLVKLVQKMRGFTYDPGRGRFRGWLKTVTGNTVRDMVSAKKRAAAAAGSDLDEVQWLNALVDEQATNELSERIEAAYQSELLGIAEKIIELKVKPHTWKAYWLTAIDQVPATDAAKELGISVADVYVAKSRVIKMLREEVQRLATSYESHRS